MARFVSRYPGYQQVAKHNTYDYITGAEILNGFICQFRNSDVTDWEREAARERYTFTGGVTDLDGTPIDPLESRVGVFDSTWIKDKALREQIETSLRQSDANGAFYFECEKPKLQPPWEKYDQLYVHGQRTMQHVIKAIVETISITGIDPEKVLEYERYNLNRPEVVDALESLLVPEEVIEVGA